MNLLRQIQYSQYWNIGFCEQTPEELIRDKRLKPIKWLKHPYRDRWFADPFILRVTESEIVVFVEECPMEHPKGIISELVIDRKTMTLKDRYSMLELDTHLSYPAIFHCDGKVYVYPENGASGKLNVYEYDEVHHRLVNPICILDEAVADATIVVNEGHYYLSATKVPNTQENAFIYESASLFGPFSQIKESPYQTDSCCSRQGGDWFRALGSLYRPAQDCSLRYGSALSVMKLLTIYGNVEERVLFHLNPVSYIYNLGLHTLNFSDGVCVIDGCGYYLPLLGRCYYGIRRLLK